MRKISINKYRAMVFDCDGVILDSNKVKTQAFYKAALPYGNSAAEALVFYHLNHGGISRYKKFEFFLCEIVGKGRVDKVELECLLAVYAESIWQGLLSCDVAQGLYQLREKFLDCRWLIASGGDQEELRRIFIHRNLYHLFDGGIFGSPDNKDFILSREVERGNIVKPGIFFGDSQYDFEAAKRAGLDFAFISGWSESKFGFSEADYVFERLDLCI